MQEKAKDLAKSEGEKYKELLGIKPVTVATIIYDQLGIVRSFSNTAVIMTGYTAEEIVGYSIEKLIQYLELGDTLETDRLYEIRTKKRQIKMVLVDKSFMKSQDDETLTVINLMDQAYNFEMYQTVVEEKKMDTLTGVYNKVGIAEQLKNEMKRASRYKDTLSIIYIQIDAFSFIDQTHGQGSGEWVLQTLAIILKNETRDVDSIGLLAEDIFVILLPATSEHSAMHVARRINDVAQKYSDTDTPFSVTTVAVGVDYYKEVDWLDEAKALLENAKKDEIS